LLVSSAAGPQAASLATFTGSGADQHL